MTALEHAARFHDKMAYDRRQSRDAEHGLDAASDPHPPMAYSAGHQIVADDSASGKRLALYAAVTLLGLVAVAGVGAPPKAAARAPSSPAGREPPEAQ